MKKRKLTLSSSVKAKLILAIVAIAAIPLIVATTVSYVTSTNKDKVEAKETLEWSTWYLEAEVNNMFAKTESALETLAASQSTVEFLQSGDSSDEVLAQMAAINSLFEDDNTITLSSAEGWMVLRSDGKDLVDIHERDYWQGAMKGEVTASAVMVSSSTKVRSICIAVPVFEPGTSNVIGTLHRNFDLNQLHQMLAEDGNECFMVDREGTLAAHSMYEISTDDEPVSYSSSPYMTSDKQSDTYISYVTGDATYLSYVKEPITGYTICMAKSVDEVVKSARMSALTTILIGLVLLAIGAVVAYLIAVSFTNPIITVGNVLAKLSDGEFEKIDKYTKRNDEFGQIVKDTNSLIDKLSAIVYSIKSTTNTVGESSVELSDMAEQISATTESVAMSVQQIATGAVQQADDIQSAAESTGEITDAVGNVQNSTTDMTALANKMKDASEYSSEALLELQKSSNEMSTNIKEIATRIHSTQDAIANINERVMGISGIAAQTNLLSLNASIEAARAGEMGKGFAVVAEEIRKLADDSESLASEIRVEMDELLAESDKAVKVAAQVMDGNIEQQSALEHTLVSVDGMLADIQETVKSVAKILEEADTCVSSNEVVANAMTSLSAISEENAASAETTGASVEELSATVTNLAESAVHLKEIAEQLNEEMKFFK
ncbi:MAG: methyl-accepting chemotaxis protein [Lachnospiraceae bacterium]|nr:methyl-accepting chemotaxis protein [Lachnospiraceae bacterium]